MGRRGPPRDPASLRDLKGSAHKRGGRLSDEIRPTQGATAPRWLPEEAANEWRRVAPTLRRLKLLTALDRPTLTTYCLAWQRLRDARVLIRELGTSLTGKKGTPYTNPAVHIESAAAAEIRATARLFGMSPTDRLQLLGSIELPESPAKARSKSTRGAHSGQ